MSSRKLSDKEFDRYARNILKKPEGIVFDEKAWTDMERKMSATQAASPQTNVKWIVTTGALIAILTYLLYLGGVQSATEANTIQSSSFSRSSFEEGSHFPAEDTLGEKNQTRTRSKISTKDHGSNNSAASYKPENSTTVTQLATSRNSSQPSDSNVSKNVPTDETPSAETTDQSPRSDSNLIGNGSSAGIALIDADEVEVLKNFEIIFLNPRSNSVAPAPIAVHMLNQKRTASNTAVDSIQIEIRPAKLFQRFQVGIAIAPDFSTVNGFNEFTSPGLDFGLSMEYFISKRISITTGAILTRKLYNTTNLEEYTFPSGIWRGGPTPEEIAANCRVIDIPINVRYRLAAAERTSVFVSAGISSYLMLNERYDYIYSADVNSANWSQGWEVSNENNHFFGVYNFSLGIVRRIRQNMYVEAEPFLKNSLGGVGWGQVQLRSTGVLFHLKYRF